MQSIAISMDKYIKTGFDMMAIETVLWDFCENCKEEGHKIWNCPYNMIKKVKREDLLDMIRCEICKAKSHIKRDCPKYKYYKDKNDEERHYEFFKYL